MTPSALLRIIRRFLRARKRISRPRKALVLIYDAENSGALVEVLSRQYSVFVLATRGSEVWINPLTIWRTATNLLRGLAPSLAYAEAIVRQVKPQAVVTYIDNSVTFHTLASLCCSTRFLAVQNGIRFPYLEGVLPSETKWSSEIALWSQFELDSYCAQRTLFKRVHVTGSLKSELSFEKHAVVSGSHPKYDLCLVGGAFRDSQGPEWHAEFKILCRQLATFLDRYEGLRGCVALRTASTSTEHDEELDFYKRNLDPRWLLLPRENDFSSYQAIDASRMVLSTGSSLSIEALGRGKRALIWHPLRTPVGSIRLRSDLILCQLPWATVESTITLLLKMSEVEFDQRFREEVSRLCEPARNARTINLLEGIAFNSVSGSVVSKAH